MAFTSKDVMDLRQKTGVGMMDCKKALVATDGDMDKAIEYLREKGLASSAKKESRIAAEGIVLDATKGNKSVLVEVNCETDFVAKSDTFVAFTKDVANYVLDNPGISVEDLIAAKEQTKAEVVLKVGEKISIRRYTLFEAEGEDVIDTYIHLGGKMGVMVEMSAGTPKQVAHDVALQIAAMNAQYVDRTQVPQEVVDKEMEILRIQAQNEDSSKPAAIIEKMLMGRINKFYKETCLVDQEFVKDPSMNIGTYLKQNGGAKIIRFTRYNMGEGIEKRQDNLAEEIAKMTQK